MAAGSRSERILTRHIGVRGNDKMQKFLFDMKDGVPMRDRVGIDFKGNLEAIERCKELGTAFS
jgi:hypothetical protein